MTWRILDAATAKAAGPLREGKVHLRTLEAAATSRPSDAEKLSLALGLALEFIPEASNGHH